MNRITDTVKHLIIINVLFFVAMQIMGPKVYTLLAEWFPENDNFRFWQVVTHMFMHSPTFYFHILMNMLALWMFGGPLEQMWGRNRFLFFYFSAGLGAVILPLLIDYYQFNQIVEQLSAYSTSFTKESIVDILNQGKYDTRWPDILGPENYDKLWAIFNKSSVGASGAVMGLLVAFGMNFPNAKLALIFLPIPIAAKYFIPVLLTYEVLSGAFGWSSVFGANVNIAHFAHVGGALIGFIIAYYWKQNQFKRWK